MKSCPVAECGEVTGIETGRDPSPKFSMFQSSCASFCFLGVYFLLALALIKRACWGGGGVQAALPDGAGVFGMRAGLHWMHLHS